MKIFRFREKIMEALKLQISIVFLLNIQLILTRFFPEVTFLIIFWSLLVIVP
jgi:hypothetical protein